MHVRDCPLCGSSGFEAFMELEADEFCRTNWTYRKDFRSILGLSADANSHLLRCLACSMVFAAELPDTTFLDVLYDRVIMKAECVAGSENASSYARRLRYTSVLLALAPSRQPLRALDFGSGLGVTLRILQACAVEAIGYDSSALRTGYSREHQSYLVGETGELPAHGPFDLLVLDNVLEHLPDPSSTVRMLGGLAAADAVVYVSVPSYEDAFLQKQIENQRRGRALDMTLNPWEHLNYFSLAHLDVLMSQGGFRRLSASERPAEPPIGLRAERARVARWKNAAASAVRLARYAVRGSALETSEDVFYRRIG